MANNETQNVIDLNSARRAAKVAAPLIQAKVALSFGKKISKHKWIVLGAVIFDLVALVPFLSVVVNVAFGFLLFHYFGPKSKTNGTANLLGIVLPIGIGSALDWILSFIPVNISAVLIRIALSDDTDLQ